MIRIGAASKVINNQLGRYVQAAGVKKKATEIRGELEANALYIETETEKILLISCDLCGLEDFITRPTCQTIGKATGIPADSILITCTHTHGGPSLIKTNYLMPVDHEYIAKLKGWLVELAKDAVSSAADGAIGHAMGETQIGYNRRVCWADGTHSMHGDCTRDDFTGMEGPVDSQHTVICAADTNNNVRAICYCNTTHPVHYYAKGVYSPDFVGVTRNILRDRFGDIPILFINGAFGDIGIQDIQNRRDETADEGSERVGAQAADETLRLMDEVTFAQDPVIRHAYDDLEVSLRFPSDEELSNARDLLARLDAGEDVASGMNVIMAHGATYLIDQFSGKKTDTLEIHAIRIGDLGIATQPCELFSQFGLDIKRRSPAPTTFVSGITNGCAGYCPTMSGIIGGGYSGSALYWTRLAPDAGYRIVDKACELLHRLWRD